MLQPCVPCQASHRERDEGSWAYHWQGSARTVLGDYGVEAQRAAVIGGDAQGKVTAEREASHKYVLVATSLQKALDYIGDFLGHGGIEKTSVEVMAIAMISQVEAQYVKAVIEQILGSGDLIGRVARPFPSVQQNHNSATMLVAAIVVSQ